MKILVNEEDLNYIEESLTNGDILKEDLRRWFKEKWVDVSKKVGGKHPPCGRKDADGKSYPKCRPSKKISKKTPKVASSYDKKEKKSMTTQKRRAEKKDPKIGKGNKPTMVKFDENYINLKPKKTIISITEEQFKRLFEFNEDTTVLIYEDEFGSVESTEFESHGLLQEAEYQGRKVQLGKIMQGDIKKFKVYVKNDKGKVVKVNFGFGGKSAKGKRMVIKKNNPKRRKSFRARHNCENPGPRWKPRYWACKTW
jgi:hypothetical protein